MENNDIYKDDTKMRRAKNQYLNLDIPISEMLNFINSKNMISYDFISQKTSNYIYDSNFFENAGLPAGMTRECYNLVNTYPNLSKNEILTILQDKLKLQDKNIKGLAETVNHVLAYNFLFDSTLTYNILDEELILKCHKILMDGLKPEIEVGNYRTINVTTGTEHIFCSPNEVKNKMKNLIENFNNQAQNITVYGQAGFLCYKLCEIHPFTDGNGRLSRLFCNWVLRSKGNIPFPISLTDPKSNKKKYRKCIEFADNNMCDTSHMSVLILIITYKSYMNAVIINQ